MERIRAALAPCQACDCGSHHGASHVRADDFTLSHRVSKVDASERRDCEAPNVTVTNLSAEDEDNLRKAMSSLFGLDPLDLLLVQHLMRGGRLSTFNRSTAFLSHRLASYHGTPRAQAHAAKERICRKFPLIAPVLTHLVGDGGGADGVRLSEVLDAENEIVESCGTGSVCKTSRKPSKRLGRSEIKQGELFG